MMQPGQFRALDAPDAPPLAVPPKAPQTTVLGVAAGTPTAPSAICAVRYDNTLLSPGDPLFGEAPLWETHYVVLGLQRLDAGTSYPETARRVNVLARRLYDRDSRGDYHVAIDASGVGQPVVETIRQSIIPQVCVTGVSISTGDKNDPSLLWRTAASIGKRYLVSRLQGILQGQRLHVPDDPLCRTLLDTLRTYPAEGDDPVPNDDLVIALALAVVSEYAAVRYDIAPDDLPSAAM